MLARKKKQQKNKHDNNNNNKYTLINKHTNEEAYAILFIQ